MEITLADILNPASGMMFSFTIEGGSTMVGHIASIKGKEVTLRYETGDGTQFHSCSPEEVTIYLEDKFRRVSQAALFHTRDFKFDRGKDTSEQFSLIIHKDKVILGPLLIQLLEMYTDKETKISFSFGITENRHTVLIPFYDGEGDYIVDESTGISEGDFENVEIALKESGYNMDLLHGYFDSLDKSLEGALKFTTSFSILTGSNLVPYITFSLSRNDSDSYDSYLMNHARTVRSTEVKREKKNSRI